MSGQKVPLSKAFLWILGSTLLISGTAFMGWLYYLHVKEKRYQDDQYQIAAIVQSNLQSDALKTAYLAEVLDLSLDRPVNLYQFNVKEGVNTLLSNPLIKEASIKKILPGTLLIHYQMRTPLAYLGDYANTVIDEGGALFPFRPFFTPKRLPILILGMKPNERQWGSSLKGERSLKLAYSIMQQFDQLKQDRFRIRQLDVSLAQDDSYGQRQVVLVLEENSQDWNASDPHSLLYLRLNADDPAQALVNFHTLQAALFDKKEEAPVKDLGAGSKIVLIDLRIPHLAFIKRASNAQGAFR